VFVFRNRVPAKLQPQIERMEYTPMHNAQNAACRGAPPDKRASIPILQEHEPTAIRVATADDQKFIDSLQRKFAGCLGFLPSVALETLTTQGHIRMASENDEPAGYILSRPRLQWCPQMRSITQAAVAMDAQRRHLGLQLLEAITAEARANGILALQACCAVGLDSNEFWAAAGFTPIAHLTPANVRGREIICWRKPLVSKVPVWFAMLPRRAGHLAHKPTSDRDPLRDHEELEDALKFLKQRPKP
jgi:N-acetylglutamate synthase-like GNAT family acetyltransferase